AAEGARGASTEPATAEQKLSALSAVADFDDWYCGNGPRRPWPHRGDVLDTVSDPVISIVAEGARQLVNAGSPTLRKTVGEALEALWAIRRPDGLTDTPAGPSVR